MASNDLGSLLDGLLGGGGQGGGSSGAGILGALLGTLGDGASGDGASGDGGNPLGGLLDTLTESRLAEQKNSWVGTGENQPVTGAQIQQALPYETLREVAERTGVSPDRVAIEIAQVLPETVDKLTPDGRVPSGSLKDIIEAQSR
ncbi:YidB family protein [Streptomyces sp. NPDC002845]